MTTWNPFKKGDKPMGNDPLATVKEDVAALPEAGPKEAGPSLSVGLDYSLSAYPWNWGLPKPAPTPLQKGVAFVLRGLGGEGLDGPQERHVEIKTQDGYRITGYVTIEKESTE